MTSAIDERMKDVLDNVERLPQPCGYKMLIALPKPEEATKGGIIKAAETRRTEEVGSICGLVVEMGPDCYKDPNRFPTGPFCKPGDWVMFRAYSGTRFTVNGVEWRLISDETVEALIDDPSGIARV